MIISCRNARAKAKLQIATFRLNAVSWYNFHIVAVDEIHVWLDSGKVAHVHHSDKKRVFEASGTPYDDVRPFDQRSTCFTKNEFEA